MGGDLGVIKLNKDISGFKNHFDRLMERGELKILAQHTSIPLFGDKNLSSNASRHYFV